MGDFNEIACQEEKLEGDLNDERRIREFQKMIFDTKLIDCGFQGHFFTLSNNREGNGLVRETG